MVDTELSKTTTTEEERYYTYYDYLIAESEQRITVAEKIPIERLFSKKFQDEKYLHYLIKQKQIMRSICLGCLSERSLENLELLADTEDNLLYLGLVKEYLTVKKLVAENNASVTELSALENGLRQQYISGLRKEILSYQQEKAKQDSLPFLP